MRYFLLSVIAILGACTTKSNYTPVEQENVREQLLGYGEENPETEVILETSHGTMRIRLYEDTPLHRANFIKNIKEGVYNDAKFYRIYYQFMVQAGIYPKELNYTLPAEFNPRHIHKKGALSMARSDENNPDRESSSTEFFIVHGSRYADYQVETEMENLGLELTFDQKEAYMTQGGYMSLDQQYTVFGEVVEGLEVIDKLASVKTYEEDKPLKAIPVTLRLR